MPLEIWNHLFHPLTHRSIDGKQQDLAPDDISRVKQIASGSFFIGALGAYSASKSVKFSIITIALTTLVIFYIAAAIIKMRNGENTDPKPPSPSTPPTLEPNQERVDREDAPNKEPDLVVESVPPIPMPPSLPHQEEDEDPIPETQELPPQMSSPPPVRLNSSATPPPQDSLILDKDKETDEATVTKEDPKDAEGKKKELKEQKLLDPKPQNLSPLSPQLGERSKTSEVDAKKEVPEKVEKTKSSPTASPRSSVPAPKEKSYSDLQLTEPEAGKIALIIKTIGNTMFLLLARKQDELTAWGKEVQHIHPLKFLETVLKNSELKQCMISIASSDKKWEGFLNGEVGGVLSLFSKAKEVPGFVEKCNRETQQNNFAIYIDDFCKAVKAPVVKVRPFVTKADWPGLVQFLINLA